MQNAWTEEIDRLRAVNKELLQACKEAMCAARLDQWEGAGAVRHEAFKALRAAVQKTEVKP